MKKISWEHLKLQIFEELEIRVTCWTLYLKVCYYYSKIQSSGGWGGAVKIEMTCAHWWIWFWSLITPLQRSAQEGMTNIFFKFLNHFLIPVLTFNLILLNAYLSVCPLPIISCSVLIFQCIWEENKFFCQHYV